MSLLIGGFLFTLRVLEQSPVTTKDHVISTMFEVELRAQFAEQRKLFCCSQIDMRNMMGLMILDKLFR